MPRLASSTGLLAARVRPVRRPKPKKIELLGCSMPAPFTLRPFAGLFNPYSEGCSVLCNHPADGDAKEVVRRVKDNLASEGKALLLPGDVELLRAGLRPAAARPKNEPDNNRDAASSPVPEELFRRYTETDSRPVSPAAAAAELGERDATAVAGELLSPARATLVLDLRAEPQHEAQEPETLSWRALSLEPSARKAEISRRGTPASAAALLRRSAVASASPTASGLPTVPALEVSEAVSSARASAVEQNEEEDEEEEDDEEDGQGKGSPMRRRGKLKRKKRKARRCSIYGQQTEVREPPDPLETQVSQIDEGSRRPSTCSRLEETKQASLDKLTMPTIKHDLAASFLPPEVLKELSRHLDQETVEWEFNPKRRFALEEALRVTRDLHPAGRICRQVPLQSATQEVPRLFYRQSARFELLDSSSLVGLKPLEYLGRHVHVSEARKLTFDRAFNRHRDESSEGGPRRLLGSQLYEALAEALGRSSLKPEELQRLEDLFGDTSDDAQLDFRTWCGVCALAERLLTELPPLDTDPPSWLERADFEGLERRLTLTSDVDERLARMLRLLRDT